MICVFKRYVAAASHPHKVTFEFATATPMAHLRFNPANVLPGSSGSYVGDCHWSAPDENDLFDWHQCCSADNNARTNSLWRRCAEIHVGRKKGVRQAKWSCLCQRGQTAAVPWGQTCLPRTYESVGLTYQNASAATESRNDMDVPQYRLSQHSALRTAAGPNLRIIKPYN